MKGLKERQPGSHHDRHDACSITTTSSSSGKTSAEQRCHHQKSQVLTRGFTVLANHGTCTVFIPVKLPTNAELPPLPIVAIITRLPQTQTESEQQDKEAIHPSELSNAISWVLFPSSLCRSQTWHFAPSILDVDICSAAGCYAQVLFPRQLSASWGVRVCHKRMFSWLKMHKEIQISEFLKDEIK